MKLIAKLYVQELHLHGNSIGDEGIRALMSGLSSRKGLRFTAVIDILSYQTFDYVTVKLTCFYMFQVNLQF